MLFNSAAFLWLFLPVVLLVHTPLLRVSVQAANSFLLAMSILFYIWGSGDLVLLLGVSVAIDYFAAALAHRGRARGIRRLQQFAVALSVAANVGLLAWFKYAGFAARVLQRYGWDSLTIPSIVLPIGISFFTFQSMSYTFDVAAGKLRPFQNPLSLLLYVSLFPQLIAGPIVRAREIADEINIRSVDLNDLAEGFSRFSWGLVKKVLVADSVAPLVDAAFGVEPTFGSAWIGALGYAVQIYFDFSGYSDMAIGLGTMLGFNFPENFRRPYAAATVTDFWRRWHITLSSWFRDYLYIPLGGNRRGAARTYLNLIAVFIVTGLWHGAATTFLVWGMWHGLALLVERWAGISVESRAPIVRLWTALVILGGWVVFRAEGMRSALSILQSAVTPAAGLPPQVSGALTPLTISSLCFGLVFAVAPPSFDPKRWLLTAGRVGVGARLALLTVGLPLVAMRVLADTFTPFLYFQF